MITITRLNNNNKKNEKKKKSVQLPVTHIILDIK